MTADSHGVDAPGHAGAVAHHAPDDHGESHGHDDHAHADEEQPLGPIDVAAWAAGIGGVAVGLVIAACFALSTGSV